MSMQMPAAGQQPSPSAPKTKSGGLAVAALVLGIVGLCISWVPILGIPGIIAAFVGLALGIIGIFVSKRAMAITGTVLSALAIIIGFSVTGAVANSINEQASAPAGNGPASPAQSVDSASSTGAAGHEVVYKVVGTGTGSMTYTTDGHFNTSQDNQTSLPWTKTVKIDGSFAPVSVMAQRMSGSGSISCSVSIDGKVVSENHSNGPYAIANCSGTIK